MVQIAKKTPGNPQKTAPENGHSARSGTTPKPSQPIRWREKAAAKRREAAETRAIDYLKAALADLSSCRKGTAERRIRESAQPMSTAKAIVRDWRMRQRLETFAPTRNFKLAETADRNDRPTTPDISAATEARAALLRRQPAELRRWAAFEDEIAGLERGLLNGDLTQKAFDARCTKIAQRPLPH